MNEMNVKQDNDTLVKRKRQISEIPEKHGFLRRKGGNAKKQ